MSCLPPLADPFLILECFEAETSHLLKAVEFDRLKFIVKILTISSCGRPTKRREIFETSGGTSPVIPSSSPMLFLGAGAPTAAAAAEAAIQALDSFLISSIANLAFSSSGLAFSAAAALSSSAFRRKIS